MTHPYLVTIEVQPSTYTKEFAATLKDRVWCAIGAEELGRVEVAVLSSNELDGADARILAYGPSGVIESRTGLGVNEIVCNRMEDIAQDITREMLERRRDGEQTSAASNLLPNEAPIRV